MDYRRRDVAAMLGAAMCAWGLGTGCSSNGAGDDRSALHGDAGDPAAASGGAKAEGAGGNAGSPTGRAGASGATSNPGTGGRAGGGGGTPDSGGAPGSGGSTTASGGTSGTAGSSGTGGSGSTLVNPAPGSKFFVGANFWNIDWEGQGDFFKSNVDFATTTDPWRPELLSDLSPYHVLRFMDWNLTNDANNPQADWSTRKQKTGKQNEPVAFEWQIDLCNRAKTDYWVNVPHESAPDYWPKLANLIKEQLDPSLRVYVEWSNEVWNAGFVVHDYAASKAQSLGLSGSDQAAAYYVYQSVRVYEAFEGVFGKGNPRLVKVLSGQAAWTGPCEAHVKALADSKINPNGTKPDFYAIAPYFGGTSLSALSDSVKEVQGWTKSSKTCASSAGVPLISYEGGSDSFAAGGDGCKNLQHDPGMHDLYTSYLDGLAASGLTGPFMQYTHTGSCWGLKERTGDDPSSSPKYKAVTDWLAAHP